MISYVRKDAQTVKVLLDRKFVGAILDSKKGFRYFPKNTNSQGGDFFPTLEACKRSLGANHE